MTDTLRTKTNNMPWYIWLLGLTISGVYVWALVKTALDGTKVDNDEYWW